MERPEDFEERKESATEEHGRFDGEGGADAVTADEDRDREGRFAGTDAPEATSEEEERGSGT